MIDAEWVFKDSYLFMKDVSIIIYLQSEKELKV